MAPPAKRRRRNIVESDEDEDAGTNSTPKKNSLQNFLFSPTGGNHQRPSTASPSPAKPPTPVPTFLPSRTRTTRASAASKPAPSISPKLTKLTTKAAAIVTARSTKSPSTSPEKSRRKRPLFDDDEKGKSADLRALFSKQKQPEKTAEPKPYIPNDLHDDPISDDDDVSFIKASSRSIVGEAARKRLKKDNNYNPSSAPPSSAGSGGTAPRGMFLKPARKVASTPVPDKGDNDNDLRPWSDRFTPLQLDELAVHKKKVSDVRQWLEMVIGGRLPRQRLLVLKGAAGTGKTTTVRLLAKDMHCKVLEWKNPSGGSGEFGLGAPSYSAQFEEFMGRGGKFGQLDIEESDSRDSRPARDSAPGSDDREQKIILIEDFPNTFMRSSGPLLSFRNAVLSYLSSLPPPASMFGQQKPKETITPIVMVISETLLTTTSASADSFTAHRLLGPEILRHPGTGVIEFNNIAPTILTKALELVVQKEARKSGRRRTPGPQVLKRLGEIGDIRSAISALQFLCIKGDDGDWGANVTFTKPKRARATPNLTKGEQESLEMISQREASLGIFHAVGKVVHNKRDEKPFVAGTPEALAERLPSYLEHASRPKRSEVSVDTLIDEMGTDTGTFLSALHENYALSCMPTGPEDMNSSVEYISDCLDQLSDSDLLCPSWDIFFGGRGPSGGYADTGSHMLRQDELGFQVAVRGLLYSLPCPVKRKPAAGARGRNAFNMYFPTSIKLWRSKEELEGLLDVWSRKLLRGEGDSEHTFTGIMDGAAAFRRNNKPQGVEAWGQRQVQNTGKAKAGGGNEPESTALVSLGSSARTEMVLERLPYMAHVARRRKGALSGGFELRDLDKVVSFASGLHPEDSDEEAEEAAAGPGESWATDKPTEEAVPCKMMKIIARGEEEVPGAVEQKLSLSDDEIED